MHLKVDAVAGAGKTSRVLEIAESTDGLVAVLTYNRSLKDSTASRGLSNLEVHTIHPRR